MFGIPPTQVENFVHNLLISAFSLDAMSGYFTGAQAEKLASGAAVLALWAWNAYTHRKALETPTEPGA